MSRNRFVQPATVRLELSEGDWIEVKARLSHGEQSRALGAALGKANLGAGDVELNYERFAVDRLLVWIVAWSFRDDRDHPVAVSRAAIAALDTETADEIDAAINQHVEVIEQAKKVRAGRLTPGAPSS